MPNRNSVSSDEIAYSLAPILRAKLKVPPARPDHVLRPRLIEGLQEGLSQRLTVVSGPPGYGKTTTVAQWLHTAEQPVGWLTCDPFDNDPLTFLRGLVAAIEQPYPNGSSRTTILLRQPSGAPASVLADALIEDLADLPGRLILTIDEFHLISNSDILTLVSRLVQFLPSNVHLVLISRTMPGLPVSLLRLRGELSEFHSTDLQFDQEEVRRFLSLSQGYQISAAAAERFTRLTEGWPGALQPALLSRRTGEAIDELADRLEGDARGFAAGFLLDEVLSRQSAQTTHFLLCTSILDTLNDSLCAAVIGQEATQPRLVELYRADLLLIPDDDRLHWFHFHPLFRDLLAERRAAVYDESTIRELHRRASRWLAARGKTDDAISHALAAGDDDAAARLVEENAHQALNRDEWWRVTRWLKMLPDDASRRPNLLIIRAWIHVLEVRIEALGRVLSELQSAMLTSGTSEQERQQIQGQLDLIFSMALLQMGHIEQAVTMGEQGLRSVPPELDFVRSTAGSYLLISHYAHAGAEEAEEAAQRLISATPEVSVFMNARILIAKAAICTSAGDMVGLQRVATTIDRIAIRSNKTVSRNWSDASEGVVHYEWNDLKQAERLLRRAVTEHYRLYGRAVVEAYVTLIQTLDALGRTADAEEAAMNLREFVVESGNLHYMPIVETCELRLSPDRLAAATSTLTPPPDLLAAKRELLFSLGISPILTRVRGLLMRPTPERLATAAAHLDVMRRAAEEIRAIRRLVETLALEALVHAAAGREEAAFEAMRRALELAEPGRLIRTLIDCGPGLGPLLRRMAEVGDSSPAIDRLLGALAGMEILEADRQGPAPSAEIASLRTVLTPRETQVLQMLARRLSNKEIAAALVLTPDSVRRYTSRIYLKLGVRNRRAAVSHAESLGLLESG